MGRKTIHKNPMTPAERQRRRRLKLKREQAALPGVAKRARRLAKAREIYIPTPPGLTRWEKMTICLGHVGSEIWTPVTKPYLSFFPEDFTDAEIADLMVRLQKEWSDGEHEKGR